jgi:hypothetical protein
MRWALLLAVLGGPVTALAQDEVLLEEVMPELNGTAQGAISVADAPGPGGTLVVRGSDVRRALGRAGASAEGLSIPDRTRISRKQIRLSTDELLAEQRGLLLEAASPCAVENVTAQKEVSVTEGPRSVRIELSGARRSGRVSGSAIVQSGRRQVRVPLLLRLRCPEPEVTAGKQVNLVAVVGNVRVSTSGEARQDGRTGEIIRVTSRTGASLRGRVLDTRTVEVLP